MEELPDILVCEECDAAYRRITLRPHEVSRCLRCNAELDRHVGDWVGRIFPLTLASLVLLLLANCFPIIELELNGLRSQTTLIGAVMMLAREGRPLVATLVLVTTLLFPLLQMLILAYLLAPSSQQRRPPGFAWLLRVVQDLRPWGMIEVFLLGILVALVKLLKIATVIPGVALWAFAALTVLLAAIVSLSPHYFWRWVELPPKAGRDD
ncbi:paraquat-inducible protein A [Herbaspirillum sp. RTI4]|uniref:paraquat-inducible protein A n=1 Tax=Herbaspirillum sp. RTI4 TaxID=3048640 RepID=UPI002AB59F51|nr:paraquat-inducible protein A [Herbaspirillum sp. RTI4]MDY7579630.1 paraquat-inducible protein A [Herbaspirillum sp. RTI4]MEA9981845.1 paraquat-inducible protein A [Herbaspirillum sp. RTI4]